MPSYRSILTVALTSILVLNGKSAISDAADLPAFEKTCTHYENRSRFDWQREVDMLAPLLAESCRIALDRYLAAGAREAGPDASYLSALTEFKATIIGMNIERFAQRQAQGGVLSQSVSKSGEYLISRHMGVMAARRHWAEATGVTLTSR